MATSHHEFAISAKEAEQARTPVQQAWELPATPAYDLADEPAHLEDEFGPAQRPLTMYNPARRRNEVYCCGHFWPVAESYCLYCNRAINSHPLPTQTHEPSHSGQLAPIVPLSFFRSQREEGK